MDKKEKILEVTDALFADKGYNVSMSDIAKGVGIKVPSIYSHYSGKDEIIFLVIEREINRFYSFLLEEIRNLKEVDCEEKLKQLYYLILNYYKQENRLRFWRGISLIQNSELKMQCGNLVREKEEQVSKELKQIFTEGMKNNRIEGIDAQGMVSFYFVLVKGVMDMMLVYQNEETDLELFFDNIWREYWFAIKGGSQ